MPILFTTSITLHAVKRIALFISKFVDWVAALLRGAIRVCVSVISYVAESKTDYD